MFRIRLYRVIEARRLMRNDGGRERDKSMHGAREESSGKQGKIHGVKDDGSETQLREVARKAAEDEE